MPSTAVHHYLAVRGADELSSQIFTVAIAWQVYAATRDPMSLAWVGLAQFLPAFCLALKAGQLADRFDRRNLVRLSLLAQTLCFAILCFKPSAVLVYALLLAIGAARAFQAPAMASLLPAIAGNQEFPRAVGASSAVQQICGITGPAIAGFLIAASEPAAFAAAAGLSAIALIQSSRLAAKPIPCPPGQDTSLLAGLRYTRSNRLLLALISLDLFAVLVGGVTALLPIFARDVLAAGPIGLGCLRCAPGVGAAIVGLVLARRTLACPAGSLMLRCVAGFGAATIVFAISTDLAVSLLALAAAGAFDMVGMVIRETLLQTSTPDAMRGRVSAVNAVFIGASSELGQFESGATAALFGAVPAALLGGLGTLAIVVLWSRIFPELRRAGSLESTLSRDAAHS